MGFFLCHGCLKRQRKLRVVIQREDRFTFKEDTNRRVALGKVTDDTNEVHHITGKTRHALRDNHVDFASFSISNHLKELLTLIERSAGNALIGIDVHQCPMWMLYDKIFIIPFLKLKGCGLVDIIRRDPDIDSNSLGYIIVVVACLFDFRNIFVVVWVNIHIDALSGFRLGLLLLKSFVFINHGATPKVYLLHYPADKPSPRGRSLCLSYPPGNRKQG